MSTDASTAAATAASTADATAAATAASTVAASGTTAINTTAAANTIGVMGSSYRSGHLFSSTPWVFQNPFGATTGGSTSSGTVGSLYGSSAGAFGTNTSGLGPIPPVQPPRVMPPAERPPKFTGADFKRWQQKALFYLTTLGFATFLTEDGPPAPSEQETNFTVRNAYDNWQHGDYMCRNYLLNILDDSLYGVYSIVKTSKEMWVALETKYRSDDVGTKKYVVSRFLDYKLVDTKPIMEQVDEFQLLIHEINAEGMPLPDAFCVAALSAKLPPSWRDFKSYLKLKRKDMTLEWLVSRIRVHVDNKRQDQVLKGAFDANANLMERGGPSNKRARPNADDKGKGKQQPVRKFDGDCYNCGKKGHLSKDCRKPKKGNNKKQKQAVNVAEKDFDEWDADDLTA